MSIPCENCTKGYVLPGDPTGTISTSNAYFAPAPETNGEGKKGGKAIILLTDSFGFSIQNPKILADHFAQELDCDVWVPDQFNGTPYIHQVTRPIWHLASNGVLLGNPPIRESELGPYLADTPNQRRSLSDRMKWLGVVIITIPGFIKNYFPRVSTRVQEVGL